MPHLDITFLLCFTEQVIEDDASKDCHKNMTKREANIEDRIKDVSDKKCDFVCDYCGKTLANKQCLKRHLIYRHKVGSFKYACHLCTKKFLCQKQLRDHIDVHKGVRIHCIECHKGFQSKSSLKKHVLDNHRQQSYPCKQCGNVYTKKNSLSEHQKAKHKSNKFTCDKCYKTFTWRSALYKHYKECNQVPWLRDSEFDL